MTIALVFMVAGISSRFDGKIKQFARVGPNNETLIEYSLNQALKAGFSKIIFIVGNKTEQGFKEMFGDSYKGVPIYYALQKYDETKRDRPWGTTDALCAAKEFLDCPFVLCNGDDIYGEESFNIIINHLKNKNNHAIIGYKIKNTLSENGSVNRGLIGTDEENNLKSMEEIFNITKENFKEKCLSEESICAVNLFAFFPDILDPLEKILIEFKEKNKEDRRIECLLSNDLGKLIDEKNLKISVHTTPEKFIGITNPGDELIVREILSSQLL